MHKALQARGPVQEKPPPLAFSVDGAADAIGISPRLMADLLKYRGVPYVLCGRRIVVPVLGLQHWLETHSIANECSAGAPQQELDC